MNLNVIVCPGCGWTSYMRPTSCPDCDYESVTEPLGLLTLAEMIVDDECEYGDVRMDLFLSAVFRHLFPDKKFGKDNPKPLRSNVYDL